MCSGRVGSSCSTSDTRRVNLVTNPVISPGRGKDREVLTTSGTYPWSYVTQIFHSGQPSHGNFNLTKRNPWFSNFFVSSNPLSKQILIGTTSSGISYQLIDIHSVCRCCWNVDTYEWKVHHRKIEIISFVVRFYS